MASVVAIGGVNIDDMCIQRLCLKMFVMSLLELPIRCASSKSICRFCIKKELLMACDTIV